MRERVLLSEPPADDAWVSGRMLRMVGARLGLLGVSVVAPDTVARFGTDRLHGRALFVSVTPKAVDRAESTIRVRASLAASTTIEVEGRASEIDALASQLALRLLKALGTEPPRGVGVLLEDFALPFSVHRLIGQADARARAGELRKARIMLERASRRLRGQIVLEGLLRARNLRMALSEANPELVRAALDRLDDARRSGDHEGALTAALDAVRFGAKPRLRWRLDLPLGPRTHVDDKSVVLGFSGGWLAVDPLSGRILHHEKAGGELLGLIEGDRLLRTKSRLVRQTKAGAARWGLAVPAHLNGGAQMSGSRYVALVGPASLGWVDAGPGRHGPTIRALTVLAVGESGAAVTSRDQPSRALSLLPPGEQAVAWTASVTPSISEVLTTTDRVVVRTPADLQVFEAHSGRPVGDTPILLPRSASLLAAHRRHAVIALPDHRVLFVDIFAGAIRAEVPGPGPAVGAYVGAFSIAVAFSSGDLIHWDPDGIVLDRALVPGRPLRVLPSEGEPSGPIVATADAVFAFSDVLPGDRSDLDLLLIAAEEAGRAGRPEDARRLATHVAKTSAGRIGRAEGTRAQSATGLPSEAAARLRTGAKARARSVSDPRTAVSPFVLFP